jgi:hypothetical protein
MTRCITTLEIVKDYFTYRLNTDEIIDFESAKLNESTTNCKFVRYETLLAFRKLGLKAEQANRECFDRYIEKLLNDEEHSDRKIFKSLKDIADILFEDNCINWGRIVILVSFCTYFTFKYSCKVNNMNKASKFACKLIEWLTTSITCKFGIWIECNGGWVS